MPALQARRVCSETPVIRAASRIVYWASGGRNVIFSLVCLAGTWMGPGVVDGGLRGSVGASPLSWTSGAFRSILSWTREFIMVSGRLRGWATDPQCSLREARIVRPKLAVPLQAPQSRPHSLNH